MKKMLTLASAALVWLSQPGYSAVTVPYESDMASDGAGWTVVNVVEGTPEFTKGNASNFSGSGYNGGPAFETGFIYNNMKDADGNIYPVDDWLISPGIELKAGVTYKVAWRAKPSCSADTTYSSSSYQFYKTVVSKANSIDELKKGSVIFDYNKTENPDSWSKSYGGGRGFMNPPGTFTPTEDGVYYFGIHFYGQVYKYEGVSMSFTGFRVEELLSSITPKEVQDFYAYRDTVAPNRVLSHIIPFRLDTLDVEGVKFPEQIKYANVKFYREATDAAGERTLIKTIENPVVGKLQWFTDDESTGLTPGKHKFVAICELSNGKKSKEANYTMSSWVGPVEPLTLPWKSDNFSSIDLTKDWVNAKGNTPNASGNWKKSSKTIVFAPSSNKPEDQYLILPPLNIEKAGIYQLLSSVKFGNNKQTNLEVYAVKGTPTTYEAFTENTKIGDINYIDSYVHSYFNAFEAPEPGLYTIAIRRHSEKAPSTSSITISMLGVEATTTTPEQVTDLLGEVIDEKAHLTWTNPAKDNVGKEITAFSKIDILRISNLNDTTVISLTKDILPGAKMEYNDSVEKPWLYNYVVLPYIGDATYPQKPVTAFKEYEWIGSMIVDLPYTIEMLSGHQQDITEPFKKVTICDHDATAYNQNFGIFSNYIYLTITKGKTYGSRLALPPMKLKKGEYKAVVTFKGGMADMPLKLSYRNDKDANDALKGKVDINTKTYSTAYHDSQVTIKVDEDGIARFVISLEGTLPSTGTSSALYINKIYIEYIPCLPAAVTDLTVTPDSTGARKATLEWTNPTKSSLNGDIPVMTKAVVYRNGKSLAEITEGIEAGKKMTYTDSVPDAGIFTYKVEIYSEDGCATAKEVRSEWIGGAKDIPYTASDYSEWNIPAASGWSIVDGHAYYENEDLVTDDWGFTPPLNLENNNYYIIEFKTWFKAAWEEVALSLNFGNDQKQDSMSSLGEFMVSGEGESNATVERFYIKASDNMARNRVIGREEGEYITLPAGKGYFGFNAKTGGSAHISDFKVYTYVPSGVEGIDAGNGIVCAGNTLLLPEGSDVVVTDLSGKVVLSANGVNSLNIGGLAKGVYVVSVSANGKHFVTKIMK